MDDLHLLPTPLNNNRQRIDSASAIQQSDVSSSRPALLAHDALGPLLFENLSMGLKEPNISIYVNQFIAQNIQLALDGFFFTINHNFEFDFVSDNVEQYLKFSQEELAGRSLYHCVHPSDVGEFSKVWAKKDAGDSLTTLVNNEQQNVQSRGRTFPCRMRTNDDSTLYLRMVVSVALHRDSLGCDKTFLICIARRPSSNDPKEKPPLLGFDQFSSRINLKYDIESLDSSHMKCETIDMNFKGKNFRDYVHNSDISSVERHFQEVIENGEGKSTVYRFCLRDDVYAFINTRSKLFPNLSTSKPDSIISTHTIVRLIENNLDLHGNAPTRLMKSIISSNRDLQRNKQQTSNKTIPTPPIGTQFALTMLGMHKNASNSLQQHVSSTLGTLIQVQNSFSTPSLSSPNDKSQSQQQQQLPPSPSTQNRLFAQKSSTLDNVSSSDAVEFGSKRAPFSPSLGSVHSNHGSLSSPVNSFDLFFSSSTPLPPNSNDLNSLLPSPINPKPSSPLFSNNDIYTTSSSPKAPTTLQHQSRSSTRLRQLLTTKSLSTNDSPSQTLHYHPENKFDDLLQEPESPTTTHVSPLTNDLPSPTKRRRNASLTQNGQNSSADVLLKKILGGQSSFSTSPTKTESNHSDDSSTNGQATNKQRSDIFLRTLLNDEVRPQKVVVEAPFVYGSRHKSNQRSSSSTNIFLGNDKTVSNDAPGTLKSQLSLQPNLNQSSNLWDNKTKKKYRPYSNSFGSRINLPAKKPGRQKRDPTDYLLATPGCQTPQSALSDGSLDALLDSSANLDHSLAQASPIVLRRTTRQTSTTNFKRAADNDEHSQNSRKVSKLLTQALKDDIKVECQDHSIISPSAALAATKPLNQSFHPLIKSEPAIFDPTPLFNKTPSSQSPIRRPNTINNNPNSLPSNSQSTLLRNLIRAPQTPSLPTKKDASLYHLLQNLDTSTPTDTSLFPSTSTTNNSIDPLEQYLTSVSSQTPTSTNVSAKDDYLAALLSSDPQQPSEISFVPTNKQQKQISKDNNRITAIANDLFHSTTNATAITNNSNDDFLTLLENKDFLDCLNESSTIDSILSQNSTSLIEQSFPSTIPKRSEKDEKAIGEIYKKLVTSFNPGSSQQTSSTLDSLSFDNSPFSSITGDLFFAESTNSMPTNRTVNPDSLLPMYRQPSVPPPSSYSYSSNNTQYSDCLSMDMLDSGTFPPNVTLSPMNNSYLAQSPTVMNTNSMMMYSQQTQPQTHIQHHQTSNVLYRQSQQQQQQQQQQPMYNNYVQPSPNQVAPGYYSMSPQQQRMSPANHHPSQIAAKRQALMQQQRTSTPMNQQQQQQVQLHMSMNVTLPHMTQNQQQQQQQQMHRPMMNSYNELMMPNSNGPPLQQDYHQYSNNNSLDLSYSPDLFMSPSSSMGHQTVQNRHMNIMQQQQPPPLPHPQSTMHQPYSNMSVAVSATIQQNTHNSNNLMNPSISNLTPAECRQSEELSNQMMNCVSFQPSRCTSEFVRKQLQNTIHGRQKPASGKDMSGATGHNSLSANLESNHKGAYFRSQLSSQMSTPPLQTTMRSQQQHGKPT